MPKSLSTSMSKSLYIPNPLHCFDVRGLAMSRAVAFVHLSVSTTEGHVGKHCTEPSLCVNCHDAASHKASDINCPMYLKEKEILRIKYTENISFHCQSKKKKEKSSKSTSPARSQSASPRGTSPSPTPHPQVEETGLFDRSFLSQNQISLDAWRIWRLQHSLLYDLVQ